MKKLFYAFPLAAAMMLPGCASDDPDLNGNGNGNESEAGAHYLAVNIVSTGDMGTRADGDPKTAGDIPYGEGGGMYEDGLKDENTVNKVRIYFFNQTGAAVNVLATPGDKNYLDCTPKSKGENDHTNTISDKLESVLLVNTAEGQRLPSQIVAVINPPSSLDKKMNLTDLKNEAANYADTKKNGFVMSNSVYLGSNGNIVDVQQVDPMFYKSSQDEAEHNPLQIYVERTVAKVRLTLNDALYTDGETFTIEGENHKLIKLKYKDGTTEKALTVPDPEGISKQVYVELLGWNVTEDVDKMNLVKRIKADWKVNGSGLSGFPTWNSTTYHRSFWADKCPGVVSQFANFNNNYPLPFTGNNYTYCNENAVKETGVRPTEVIIPGRLCDKDGNSLTICEYAGQRFIDNPGADGKQLPVIKRMFANMLHADVDHKYLKKITDGSTGKTVYREIEADDIDFVTAYVVPSVDNLQRYYVYACLSEQAQKYEWYKSDPTAPVVEGDPVPTDVIDPNRWTISDLNGVLKELQHVKIWNTGMTYYFVTIKHLGEAGSNAEFGVVRNHVYDMKINSLYGLGTPVYNPDQIIIPETPNPEDVFVAAQINVLSWRIVSNDVNLDWGK